MATSDECQAVWTVQRSYNHPSHALDTSLSIEESDQIDDFKVVPKLSPSALTTQTGF
jgi:hypothetical protein